MRFGRDELGRIVDAAFADGSSARYFHELGSRVLAEYSDGSAFEYEHDTAGSRIRVGETGLSGASHMETPAVEVVVPPRIQAPQVAVSGSGRHRGGGHRLADMPKTIVGERLVNGDKPDMASSADIQALLVQDKAAGSQTGVPGFDHAQFEHELATAGVPFLSEARDSLEAATRVLRDGPGNGRRGVLATAFLPLEVRLAELPFAGARQRSGNAPCAPPTPQEVAPAPMERIPNLPSPAGKWVTGTVESPGYNVGSLRCEEFGLGHYIVGDIAFAAATKGKVATVVSAPQGTSCKERDRTQANIDLSIAHERHHLDKYKEVLDDYQLMSRGPFVSGECDDNLRDLKNDLRDDFRDENTEQNCHRDSVYANERQRENYCDGANRARERAGARVYPDC